MISPAIAMLFKITAAAALGLVAVWLARRSRASVRHSILVVTFGGLLLLPLGSLFAPPLKIPVAVAMPRFSTMDPIPLDTSVLDTPFAGSSAAGPSRDGQHSGSVSGSGHLFVIWLLAIWLAGAGIFLVPPAIGLWQAHAIRRTGLPWRDGQLLADLLMAETPGGRRADVRFHEDLSGPVTCGVLRPAVLFPPDAAAWNDEDVSRALVHELAHVRRADRVWQGFARVLCAAYWFHPLVWVAWRRLALEAEKSCDDAVLARWSSAGYADQLVALARRYSQARPRSGRESYALGMGGRSDLGARVHAMLDCGQRRGRAGTRAVVLSCCAAASIIVAMSAFRLVAAPQAGDADPAPGTVRFDVVSVKVDHNGTGGAGDEFPVNGTWRWKAIPMPAIVGYAYGISWNRVEGVPKALQGPDPAFDVMAKMPVETSRKDFRLMLQSLLADRFKAAIHTEVRDIPVHTIEVAKGGVKLQPASGECVTEVGSASLPAGQHRCHEIDVRVGMYTAGTITWRYSGWSVSMADLAKKISTNGLVVDDTGLSGLYDFDVKIETQQSQDNIEGQANYQYEWRNAWEKQAGLTIDLSKTKKRPGTVVVVDHVELPTPN